MIGKKDPRPKTEAAKLSARLLRTLQKEDTHRGTWLKWHDKVTELATRLDELGYRPNKNEDLIEFWKGFKGEKE